LPEKFKIGVEIVMPKIGQTRPCLIKLRPGRN